MSDVTLRDDDFRALQLFNHVPAGHKGVLVTGRDFEPHLRRGEFAIVDEADKSIQFGELYVLTIGSGRHEHLATVQLLRQTVGLWWGFSLAGKGGTVIDGRRCRYVDGPLRYECWPDKCVGRVVGVMKPAWEGREC